jgi:hypothetical protein
MEAKKDQTYSGMYEELVSVYGAEGAREFLQHGTHILLPESDYLSRNPTLTNLVYTSKVVRVPLHFLASLQLSVSHLDIADIDLAANLDAFCDQLGVNMKQLVGFTITSPPDAYYILAVTLMLAAATGKTTDLLTSVVNQSFGITISTQSIAQIIAGSQTIRGASASRQHAIAHGTTGTKKTTQTRIPLESKEAHQHAKSLALMAKVADSKERLDQEMVRLNSRVLYSNSLQQKSEMLGLGESIEAAREALLARQNVNPLEAHERPVQGIDRTVLLKNFINGMTFKSYLLRLLKLHLPNADFDRGICYVAMEFEKYHLRQLASRMHASAKDVYTVVTPQHIIRRYNDDERAVLNTEMTLSVGIADLVKQMNSLDLITHVEFVNGAGTATIINYNAEVIPQDEAETQNRAEVENLVHEVDSLRANRVNQARRRAHPQMNVRNPGDNRQEQGNDEGPGRGPANNENPRENLRQHGQHEPQREGNDVPFFQAEANQPRPPQNPFQRANIPINNPAPQNNNQNVQNVQNNAPEVQLQVQNNQQPLERNNPLANQPPNLAYVLGALQQNPQLLAEIAQLLQNVQQGVQPAMQNLPHRGVNDPQFNPQEGLLDPLFNTPALVRTPNILPTPPVPIHEGQNQNQNNNQQDNNNENNNFIIEEPNNHPDN